MTQNTTGLIYKAINNAVPNSIIKVSSIGTAKVAVSTSLVCAIFTDLTDNQSPIYFKGIAMLEFLS